MEKDELRELKNYLQQTSLNLASIVRSLNRVTQTSQIFADFAEELDSVLKAANRAGTANTKASLLVGKIDE